MIYRQAEGWTYRNGLNWTYVRIGNGWWFSIVLKVARIKVGFRFRTYFTPHFINYSEILPK